MMTARSLLLTLSCLLVGAGCNCGTLCGTDVDCDAGSTCRDGSCIPAAPTDAGGGEARVDAGVDAGRDAPDAGPDGGPDAGSCVRLEDAERACEDGRDGDCDGLTDCEDSDCLARPCDCPGGACAPTDFGPCLAPDAGLDGGGAPGRDGGLDAGLDPACDGVQRREVPRCQADRTCRREPEERWCGRSGPVCGVGAWTACSRSGTTACTGQRSRATGVCQAGACQPGQPEVQACNMAAGTVCNRNFCCGPGQAGYARCGGRCGSEIYDQSCDGAGACNRNVCVRVVCWGTGCGTGGEVSSVACPL